MNNANDRLDYLIGLAMLDYAADEVAEFDAIDDTGVTIDESLDKRIYRLIGKKERELKARKIRKISFRVAVAAMLVMSVMLLSMLLISGVREAIWNAIVKWYDDYLAVVFVSDETDMSAQMGEQKSDEKVNGQTPGSEEINDVQAALPTQILEYRKPRVLDVYGEVELEKHVSYYTVDYYIGEDWIFVYWQNLYDKEEQIFDNMETEVKKVSIGIHGGVVLTKEEGQNTITWTDGEYLYTITGYLTESQLIEIAKTVE